MSMLTKEVILAAQDLPRELVNVPEWGGDVYVGTLTGLQRDKFEMTIVDANKNKKNIKLNTENIRATLAAMTMQDEAGNLLFTMEDVKALGNKSCAALQRIYDAATKLNRLSKTDEEELTKN